MSLRRDLRLRPFRGGERGQVVPLVAASVVALLAIAALVVDGGNLYYSHQKLAAASDAAALAGGYDIPNTTTATATTDATRWSAVAGGLNANQNLTNVSITVGFKCLTTVGVPCLVPPGGSQAINAISVTQHASVNSFFARILGIKSFTTTATATAIPRSGASTPTDLMVVLDTTESMSTADPNCTVAGLTNPTREQCALAAVRALLDNLDPCSGSLATCGPISNGNVANPVAQVGLMVFPGLTPTESKTLSNPPVAAPTATDDYVCPGSNPSITSYNSNPGYLILPLQSNYRNSDSSALNTAAGLVIASGGNSCSSGVGDPGGEGTFYAGAIAAAQSYLLANSRTNASNVMILLSDGNASASSKQMAGSATSYASTNECHQAITASQNAQAAGIKVYAVAYGAEATGCSTDSPAITPCTTMEDIASVPTANYFFSDANQSGQGINTSCTNASRPISNLNQAFTAIAGDLSAARLVPNNTT
jgi:hypothetical protein